MTDWTDPAALDLSDPDCFGRLLDRAESRETGNYFEFFEAGQEIDHDAGLELSHAGSERWMGPTLNHDPAYWRTDRARERGFDERPVHPDYLLACVMGITVPDLSEKGGYFLGRDGLTYHRSAAPGTQLAVSSTVRDTRTSESRPAYGIVTWETVGRDRETGEKLVSYERTNMLPRREPAATDGGETVGADDSEDSGGPSLPDTLVVPDGESFEAFRAAIERARAEAGAVAYGHERGRTIDDALLSGLPLATLNTARQHHNRDVMADTPSGEPVAYGDVTRSIALAQARSDEATYREWRFDDERFHEFVTRGDTVYGFTRVLDCDGAAGPDEAGAVTFEHVAYTQHRTPVYSGRRTALVQRHHR